MKNDGKTYHDRVRELSDRIVNAEQPIRILDSIKWEPVIQESFFKKQCKELPVVNLDYYNNRPLLFNFEKKQEEFQIIERDIHHSLGSTSAVSRIMLHRCQEYRDVLDLLKVRGTPNFSVLSKKLYGRVDDVFYVNAPSLKDLAQTVSAALGKIKDKTINELDEKRYNSKEAAELLNQRLAHYFSNSKRCGQGWVKVSDGIVADAAAGSEWIKIRKDACFSERDLRILEVHEGWVHMGTTLNGLEQPICTFLSKGPPSTTVIQEGLAIIMEIFHFVSSPSRVKKLIDRITGIAMVEEGANFLETFHFFQEQDYTPIESYKNTVRIFRGSLPNQGPFTKDLGYSKGFILIYNYLRLAVQNGLLDRIPLLFVGKTRLDDQYLLSNMLDEGLIIPPRYIPPQFKDLSALSCWMCYSLFLNKLDLERVAVDYRDILQR